jgi:hypothetical protein
MRMRRIRGRIDFDCAFDIRYVEMTTTGKRFPPIPQHLAAVQRDAAKTRVRMAAFLAAAGKAFFSVREAELAGAGASAGSARNPG